MPLDEGHVDPVARNCECGHVLRATLVVEPRLVLLFLERSVISIVHLAIRATARNHRKRAARGYSGRKIRAARRNGSRQTYM